MKSNLSTQFSRSIYYFLYSWVYYLVLFSSKMCPHCQLQYSSLTIDQRNRFELLFLSFIWLVWGSANYDLWAKSSLLLIFIWLTKIGYYILKQLENNIKRRVCDAWKLHEIQISMSINFLKLTHHIHSFMYRLWQVSCHDFRFEEVQQSLNSPKSLETLSRKSLPISELVCVKKWLNKETNWGCSNALIAK